MRTAKIREVNAGFGASNSRWSTEKRVISCPMQKLTSLNF